MALKDTWIDRVDGEDYVLAEDINSIARAVIQNETDIKDLKENQGGGSSEGTSPFIAIYGETTYEELSEAFDQGKNIILNYSGVYAQLSYIDLGIFTFVYTINNGDAVYLNSFYIGRNDSVVPEWRKSSIALQPQLPDADTMSFPLEETVSEVSEE